MGLRQDILNHRVSELDLRDPLRVEPGTTCHDAIEAMRTHRVGYALVLDDAGKPVGMFTERHLVNLLVNNPAALDEPVAQHMNQTVNCLRNDKPIAEIIKKLRSPEWRFVCIVDAQGKAVGVTGHRGVMEYIADHFPRQVKVQMMRSKLYMDQREGA